MTMKYTTCNIYEKEKAKPYQADYNPKLNNRSKKEAKYCIKTYSSHNKRVEKVISFRKWCEML